MEQIAVPKRFGWFNCFIQSSESDDPEVLLDGSKLSSVDSELSSVDSELSSDDSEISSGDSDSSSKKKK